MLSKTFFHGTLFSLLLLSACTSPHADTHATPAWFAAKPGASDKVLDVSENASVETSHFHISLKDVVQHVDERNNSSIRVRYQFTPRDGIATDCLSWNVPFIQDSDALVGHSIDTGFVGAAPVVDCEIVEGIGYVSADFPHLSQAPDKWVVIFGNKSTGKYELLGAIPK